MLADELVELVEVTEHELDLRERPLHLVVLVEILAELLLHAEAAITLAPVDLASALAAVGFLLLNALLAVAAEHGVRRKVRRGTHLTLVVVLATIAEEILVLSPDRVHTVIIQDHVPALGDRLGGPRALGLVPVLKRAVLCLLSVGVLQCHPDGVVDAIHCVVAEDRAEGFFQVIERELRRLVRRDRLHESRTRIVHCRIHLFSLPPRNSICGGSWIRFHVCFTARLLFGILLGGAFAVSKMSSCTRITHSHPQNAILVAKQTLRGSKLFGLLAVLLEDVLPIMGLLQKLGNVDLAFHEGLDKRKHNVKPIATIRPESPNKSFQNVTELLGIRATMDGR